MESSDRLGWVDCRPGQTPDVALLRRALSDPNAVRIHVDARVATNHSDVFLAIYKALEVPYFGEDPDWSRILPNRDGANDIFSDLEWLGVEQRGIVLNVELPGQVAGIEDHLLDSWSYATSRWRDRTNVPVILVLL